MRSSLVTILAAASLVLPVLAAPAPIAAVAGRDASVEARSPFWHGEVADDTDSEKRDIQARAPFFFEGEVDETSDIESRAPFWHGEVADDTDSEKRDIESREPFWHLPLDETDSEKRDTEFFPPKRNVNAN